METKKIMSEGRDKCPKYMLNGPCGGVRNGLCEVKNEVCAWVVVFNRIKAIKKLDDFVKVRMPGDAI